MMIKKIYNIIEVLYCLDWISLIIAIGVCITTIVIGLLVVSPMGVSPI
jgi:hypothetical protein